MPDFDTRPMRPAGVMSAGMMPALLAPGEAMPGQFGPTIRVLLPDATLCAQTAVESCTGMPSVMTTASVDARVDRLDDRAPWRTSAARR